VKELAEGVWHVKCLPGLPWAVNAYLIGDVLIDAGGRQSAGRILRQLEGHDVSVHALTHNHHDHTGGSHAVCEKLGVPYWCPERDVAGAETPKAILDDMPDTFMSRFFWRTFHGPGHKVDRRLKAGDEVAGFQVIEAPGHSPGQVAYWRESDKVLVIGDVLANIDQIILIPGLHEPSPMLTIDPARNRESARKLGALEPELVCFGHGAPLRDPDKLKRFVDRLPD
jgi:hydroxyacylglutathione hydrolase